MMLEEIGSYKVTEESARIETTLGDLICAISDAARESMVDERELARLTQLVLINVLDRCKH